MARPSSAAPRNLTLTEELEKLEQSITLTLQGEDWKDTMYQFEQG
jgi:DASH complex subunit ASK1